MRVRVGMWAAAAVALVLLSACVAQAAHGVDIDPAVSLKVAAAKSPQAAQQVAAAIKAVQAEEASLDLEASQEVQKAESSVAAEQSERSERSENGEESSEVSLAELEDDLANLMARKLKGEETEGEQLNVEIGLLVKKISAIKDAKAAAAQLAADGGKYVNHKLDPLVNILTTLRGLKDGLKGLNVSDFNTLQLNVKALAERIDEFQSEQSAESSQAATTTMCVEYDRCGNPHFFVTADEKKDNCGDDPCQSNTVVVPTIVHRTCEAPTCTVEAKSLTSTCSVCHQERSVCHRQCGVKSGQALDSVCQNKCEVRVRACHETCDSDVVRADVVHPNTEQVNSSCTGAPAGCKQAPQVVPKGALSDRNVILSL